MTIEEADTMKTNRRVDELICGWSMMTGHSFKEEELNGLVDLLADDFKAQLVKTHAHGVRAGKQLNKIAILEMLRSEQAKHHGKEKSDQRFRSSWGPTLMAASAWADLIEERFKGKKEAKDE